MKIATVVLALILLLCYAGFQHWRYAFIKPFNDLPFDRMVWQKNTSTGEAWNPRGKMVGDLMENHLHVGMPQKEVIHLLGKPDFNSYKESKMPLKEQRLFGYVW